MDLEIEMQGMKIGMTITGYSGVDDEGGMSPWCKVSYSFVFNDVIRYEVEKDEILDSVEVKIIKETLDDLLEDKQTEIKNMEFTEPDWEFTFHPKINVIESGKYVYAAPGHEIEDIRLIWKINLWNEGLTVNCFSTELWRAEIIY